ncbi:MAG: hypothetical protein AAB353_02915 [Candidatus Hydrogenedentota bacterium]
MMTNIFRWSIGIPWFTFGIGGTMVGGYQSFVTLTDDFPDTGLEVSWLLFLAFALLSASGGFGTMHRDRMSLIAIIVVGVILFLYSALCVLMLGLEFGAAYLAMLFVLGIYSMYSIAGAVSILEEIAEK